MPDAHYQATCDTLKSLLGEKAWKQGKDAERYFVDPRGRFTGRGALIVMPENTAEVSKIVKLCNQSNISIIPYSGGTGVVAGQLSVDSSDVVIMSLERMNKIRKTSLEDASLVAEAGCILSDIHVAAEQHDMQFPLSMASEGSCCIGGNLATNAGGIQVLRYGNARDLCIGIEAVLPDGSILNELHPLRKNNTGYDLRHLLIGSEGTLGIITAACLSLKPASPETTTVFCALNSPTDAVSILHHIRKDIGEHVNAMELISELGINLLAEHFPEITNPLQCRAPYYLLLETSGKKGLREDFENSLFLAMESNLIIDAVIAESEAQRKALWKIRETMAEANRLSGAICNSDTSVPISKIDAFTVMTTKAVLAIHSDLRINGYGHIGDGNMHINVLPPEGMTKAELVQANPQIVHAVRQAINETTHQCHGTISAEHGIGRLKCHDLIQYTDQTKLSVMRSIKKALDPHNIMNPGAIFDF